jgi:sugar lactone lactonase YvrE
MIERGLNRRQALGGILAATAVAATGLASPAKADVAGTARAKGRTDPSFPATIICQADSLFPEGIDWDPTRNAFIVSSTRQGTVSIVDGTGTVTPLVPDPDPRIVSTVGLRVDAARGRVLVAYDDIGLGTRSSSASALRVTGLAEYDLATGEQIRLVDLAIGSSPIHAADRLAVDGKGNAYVSDPAAGNIYLVTPAGEASILVTSEQLLGPGTNTTVEGTGVTGVAYDRSGFLLVNDYTAGQLVRIPLRNPGALSSLVQNNALVGGDGSVLLSNGSLLVATNQIATSSGHNAVVQVFPNSGWTGVCGVRSISLSLTAPTDVVVTPYGTYVLDGHANLLSSGGSSSSFVLSRLRSTRLNDL